MDYWWGVCTVNRKKDHLYPISLSPAAFIRVVGSEFVQKYLGEGPRMVRDVFRLAKENAPAIIFIDEIDAIATKRFDAQTGGMVLHFFCFPDYIRVNAVTLGLKCTLCFFFFCS